MENGEEGYVYIMDNPSLKDGYVKIGKATSQAELRAVMANNKAMPEPDEIYATLRTNKYEYVERFMHKILALLTGKTAEQGNGYFKADPSKAADILKDIAVLVDDARIDYQPIDPPEGSSPLPRKKRPRFRFSMVGLNPGDTITFDPTGIEVKVASDNQVEYLGERYKLSPFVAKFMPKHWRNDSGAYQGSKYFSYKGKVLQEMREAREK